MIRSASLALAGCVAVQGISSNAKAQPATPSPHPTDKVIHPPANVDPGMAVAPRRTVRMPTPVIHPPLRKGDTVVVPR
jgi:hypothetical protein